MTVAEGTALLRGRYFLVGDPSPGEDGSMSWRARGDDGSPYLVKTWAYQGDEPDKVRRALWDAELRTLYKVGSTPGAADSLVVLKDAGLDRDARAFVMVLEAPGYDHLDAALSGSAVPSWLRHRDTSSRRDIWVALGALARGLALLHDQQVLHRDVGVEAVVLNTDEGASSLRLGGFEWSVRLGRPLDAEPPVNWAAPPERGAGGAVAWRPDDDWFGFGMLCVRLMLDVESYSSNEPRERHERVLKAVAEATLVLTENERGMLLRLLAVDPLERMTRAEDVLEGIRGVVTVLAAPPTRREDASPYTLVVNSKGSGLIDYLVENGLKEHLGLSLDEAYSPQDPIHAAGLCDFLRKDLEAAELFAVPRQSFFVLVGKRLIIRVGQNTDRSERKSWQTAFCLGPGELRAVEEGAPQVALPEGRLAVRTLAQVWNDRTVALESADWQGVLPKAERSTTLSPDLARFQEFVRAANQIELLLLDATIFPYELVGDPEVAGGTERIVVRERARAEHRKVLRFFELEKGLDEFLQREMEAGKADTGSVILSGPDQDALMLPAGGRDNQWRVKGVDPEQRSATLERDAFDALRPEPAKEGFLRGAGMPGQTRLIKRRKQAIDNLGLHGYLLRSLAAPGQVYIDTGQAPLPVDLDPSTVDGAKRAVIEDILRVRPIYTLQGPPGTGKTTLVAWLLREILKDDPVAQVLVTAQAHGAVDVLRGRVTEAFADVAVDERPLAVRLGGRREEPGALQDTVEQVALEALNGSIASIDETGPRTGLQEQWVERARSMADELTRHEALGSRASDFVELVKRGANLTYCTTSAGELEALAADQSFDWSIVEEAGKAHGFDLALPLQAGHRWLLIGDHQQLPPYRYEDYLDGLQSLDSVVEALSALPDNASGLLDWEWVTSWRERPEAARDEFRDYARAWLKTFKQAFEHCSVAVGGGDAGRRLTTETTRGAAAGMLLEQHRMHPDIGDLISHAYYDERLVNRTEVAGAPLPRVLHGLDHPDGIAGAAVVWLDVPWSRHDPRTREIGPAQGRPRYSNEAEAAALRSFLDTLGPDRTVPGDIAFLSPYARQVSVLRQRLAGVHLPDGLNPKPGLNARPPAPGRMEGVHTVDSFQGNQADLIVVSLVRNNDEPPGKGMGFLDEGSRLNVLLSRAEQMLVLVGSWEFFMHQTSLVQLDDPMNPLWHWKRITADLEDWFTSGRAVRLSADLVGLT